MTKHTCGDNTCPASLTKLTSQSNLQQSVWPLTVIMATRVHSIIPEEN